MYGRPFLAVGPKQPLVIDRHAFASQQRMEAGFTEFTPSPTFLQSSQAGTLNVIAFGLASPAVC
jgi:hypothetical protein